MRCERGRTPQSLLAAAIWLLLLACVLAGCGGGDERDPAPSRDLTLWLLESEPDRVAATRANLARFTRSAGLRANLVVIGEGELSARMAAATRDGRPPDVVQLGMATAHAYARDGTLSPDAAQDVVDQLGEETFTARSLSLLTREGRVTAVPSDGWGQLLIYRKDLFDAAGLPAPRTLQDVRRAARRLDRPGRAGITLATTPSAFTAETFEHVALAAGCDLLDDRGDVALTSRSCEQAFATYLELAHDYSVGGEQDVDSTRDAYFAGRAAMIFWSPFLLDAMAGLRDDAAPDCPQCRAHPGYLARNSGLVGALTAPGGAPAQFGTVTTWGIPANGQIEGAKRLVTYLMSDGYLDWLALSPQGKYPMRLGDRADPERFVTGWAKLRSGVDRKAPLSRFYAASSIDAIGDGARSFRRWGFEQGAAALLGAMESPQPVSMALAAAIANGGDPADAARQAQRAVERLQDSLG